MVSLVHGWFDAVKRLSIVIPAIGPQADIDDTLISILENRPADCEVLVVHEPDYVDPYDIADEVRFVTLPRISKNRHRVPFVDVLESFNLGFGYCRGEVIHTLLPGVTVGPSWCDLALQRFEEDRNVGSVSPCVVARGNRRTIQGVTYQSGRGKRIVHNSKRQIIAPLLGTGFYRATSLRFMHGFLTKFGTYADVEMGLRMKSANYNATKCDSRIYSGSTQKFSPITGFAGGRLRGELYLHARRIGLVTARQGIVGLLSEPFQNGLGAIGATVGRALAYCSQASTQVIPLNPSTDDSNRQSDERAA